MTVQSVDVVLFPDEDALIDVDVTDDDGVDVDITGYTLSFTVTRSGSVVFVVANASITKPASDTARIPITAAQATILAGAEPNAHRFVLRRTDAASHKVIARGRLRILTP